MEENNEEIQNTKKKIKGKKRRIASRILAAFIASVMILATILGTVAYIFYNI